MKVTGMDRWTHTHPHTHTHGWGTTSYGEGVDQNDWDQGKGNEVKMITLYVYENIMKPIVEYN